MGGRRFSSHPCSYLVSDAPERISIVRTKISPHLRLPSRKKRSTFGPVNLFTRQIHAKPSKCLATVLPTDAVTGEIPCSRTKLRWLGSRWVVRRKRIRSTDKKFSPPATTPPPTGPVSSRRPVVSCVSCTSRSAELLPSAVTAVPSCLV